MPRLIGPRVIGRRLSLLAPLCTALLMAACSEEPPARTNFPPLNYSYLPVLRLSVASITIKDEAPIEANDFSPQSPVLPVDALTLMANQRLQAAGTSGTAVFVIDRASLIRTDTGLVGNFAVHIDVQSSDHQHVAYASAKVTRTYTGDLSDLRGTLYDMTKQMMDDMNVELEVQIRRTLGDWLQNVTPASELAPVQSQTLPSDNGSLPPSAPSTGTASPLPPPVPISP